MEGGNKIPQFLKLHRLPWIKANLRNPKVLYPALAVSLMVIAGILYLLWPSNKPSNAPIQAVAGFNQKFSTCTPATSDITSQDVIVHYQIFGQEGKGCKMSVEYSKYPDSHWLNQPMTCTFDNKYSPAMEIAIIIPDIQNKTNLHGCTGPLVSVIQSKE